MAPTWIQTNSGKRFIMGEFDPRVLDLNDIAHGLSHVNRYNGQTPVPYSVAQHSVLVARRVEELGGNARTKLAALLHDASEAYLGDITSPLKALLPEYKVLEKKLQRLIEDRFVPLGDDIDRDLITRADLEMLATEANIFFPPAHRPHPWVLKYEPLSGYLDTLAFVEIAPQARGEFIRHYERLYT